MRIVAFFIFYYLNYTVLQSFLTNQTCYEKKITLI